MPLKGAIVDTAKLKPTEIARMLDLMRQYFDNVAPDAFQRDLADKNWIIVLRDAETGEIYGFSTLCLLEETVDNTPVRAFFSGDTIIDKPHWGSLELERTWFHFLYSRIDAEPHCRWYWYLICKGYRTFRYLPIYFHHFYPSTEDTPAFEKQIIQHLSAVRFGDAFNHVTGIIHCENDYRLREGISDITDSERRDQRVAFFEKMNPDWRDGDELACLASLNYDNLKRCAYRILGKVPVK